jgi:acetolactate synthase small subunit
VTAVGPAAAIPGAVGAAAVPPAAGSLDRRWVAFVLGADATGTLTGLTGVFSTRGVSFDSLTTGDVADGVGLIVVTFTASERRQRLLTRTVRRLAAVRAAEVRAVDDPAVRVAAVVHLPASAGDFVPSGDAAVRWSGDPAAGQPLLVEGPLPDVERVVAAARARGADSVATVVLPLPEAEFTES